jgi:hypothetical protein
MFFVGILFSIVGLLASRWAKNAKQEAQVLPDHRTRETPPEWGLNDVVVEFVEKLGIGLLFLGVTMILFFSITYVIYLL